MTAFKQLTLALFFAFIGITSLSQPIVNSFSPQNGLIGTTVTINGSNFSSTAANNIVYFGAVRANVLTASSGTLTVSAPAGATYRPISVTVNGLTGYSAVPFIITFPDGIDITQFPDQSQNLFAQKIDSTTGLHPNAVNIADFDGDGKPDIATPNNFSTTGEPASVSLLRNTSASNTISFEAHEDIATGVLTNSMATGDLNGDGRIDMVSGSVLDKTISIFRNTSVTGDITFAPKVDLATGNTPESIAIADMDLDGKPDIVISNSSLTAVNMISVFRNTSSSGTISFAARVDFQIPFLLGAVVACDLDGDKKPDVGVTSEFSNVIYVLRNTSTTGAISFAATQQFTTANGPEGIFAGDVDGDGKSELLATNLSGTFSILRNTSTAGSINFATKIDFNCGINAYSIELADMNGDAKVDVIIPSMNLAVLQNNSTPGSISLGGLVYTFSFPASNATGAADFTGDGKADLGASLFSNDRISIFRNKINEPIVRSFSPATAATGATVTITGMNFNGTTGVLIGGLPAASFTIVNSTTITAVVGAGFSGAVSVINQHGRGSLEGFVFAGPPIIQSFTPQSGPVGGMITINGFNFTGATSVSFAGTPTSNFTVVSPNQIIAEIQATTSGAIAVTTPYGTGTRVGFRLIPGITGFSPTSAATNQTVTITGTNLQLVTQLSFGGIPATTFTIVNPETIHAVVGEGRSGNVRVATNIDSTVLPGFVYIPAPSITSFTPMSAGQGTTVSITGTDFTDAVAVNFGGVPASTFTVVNSTTITATVANGASGNVLVATPGGSATRPGFEFIPQPYIEQFIPVRTGAGATVTIYGNNFTGATSVTFGGTAPSSFTVVNSTTITAVIGSGSSGNVVVTTPGGVFTRQGFIHTGLPVINSFAPHSGAVGTSVILTGANFNTTAGNTHVYFGAVKAVITNITSNSITVTVPFGASQELISVTSGNKTCHSSGQFTVTFPGGGPFTATSFVGKLDLQAGDNTRGVVTADFDGDGKPDIAAANFFSRTISIFKNQSPANQLSFADKIDLDAGNSPYILAAADLDGDGKLDLISINNTGGNNNGSVFRNTSSGSVISFGARQDFFTEFNPCNILVADFTNDGKPDIVMAHTNLKIDGRSVITISTNNSDPGNIIIQHPNTIPITDHVSDNETPISIDKGDFNNDGYIDLVVGYINSFHRHVITVLRNDGFPSPQRIDIQAQTLGVGVLTVADFDNDGRPDIVGNGEVFRNIGNFNFEHLTADDMGIVPHIGDLNGDGKIDYIKANTSSSSVTVHGNETVGSNIQLPEGFSYETGVEPYSVKINDLDADGRPEIITGNNIDGRVSILKNGFGYTGPVITSFSPTSGSTATVVTITGTGFINVTAVSIGGVPVTSFIVNSPTSITATAAAGNTGNVKVVTALGDASRGWFTFIPPAPTITSFTPQSAPDRAEVIITGTNFTEVTSVTFGNQPALYFNVISPTSIKAIIDAGATGDVVVTTLGGVATKTGFVFIGHPTITSFTPLTAPGGATMQITGTNLLNATSVTIGGTPATSYIVNSATSITAVIGNGATGSVSVTTIAGTASLAGFIFIPAPVITSFTPASAQIGFAVTITGLNFTGATAVSFGGVPASSFVVNSATTITAVLANGASGNVSVTTPGGTATRAGFVFNFPTGINGPRNNNSPDLVAFPNPARDLITVRHPSKTKKAAMRVIDIQGREVLTKEIEPNKSQSEISVAGLAKGVYQLIYTDGRLILSRTLFVE